MTQKTRLIIELETDFKNIKDEDGEDISGDIEKGFHLEVIDYINDWLTDNEEFEGDILEKLELEENYDTFSKLGDVRFSYFEENSK